MRLKGVFFCTMFLPLLYSFTSLAEVKPHSGMMRYPDVSASHIVFVYADNIWIVPRTGGVASPLTSPPGGEAFPRFSPDGQTIAFCGSYDGNCDIYILPVQGGIPQRLTYHSSEERLCDWTSDNRLVFAMNGLGGLARQNKLFILPRTDGLPERLPVPYGDFGTISDDGQWLAYTPHNRDFATWKRYRGGLASDIWLFNLKNKTSKKITTWEGTDTIPMWQEKKIYYLSDEGPDHRLNIWSLDIETNNRKQITHFKDYDVKWPSNGPGAHNKGEIIFEYDGQLYLLDLASEEAAPVTISVPGDRPQLRPTQKDVHGKLSQWYISPHAKRVLVQTRGDIWSLPAGYGTPRNLTQSSGIAEREPSWSPDGKWITYFSDESGENELVMCAVDEKSKPETITSMGPGYRYQPVWSPDSRYMVFTDHEDKFYLFKVKERKIHQFDRVNISGFIKGMPSTVPNLFCWSPDSAWLAYVKPNPDHMYVIMLYQVREDKLYQVTSGMFADYLPAFDRKGDFLYFFSRRDITHSGYEDAGLTFIYKDTSLLHAIPLRSDVSNPFKAKSDEEVPEREDKKDQDKEKENQKPGEEKSMVIDVKEMEKRAFRLPVKRGRFSYLGVNDSNQLIYLRDGENSTLQLFDPNAEKPEEKTILSEVSLVQMTPDGKKLLVCSRGKTGIIEAKPDQELVNLVITEPMNVVIDPRQEWQQIFTDVWRFMRDYFYDPHMHQVDWPAVRKKYQAMLEDCVSRRDVGYVISEMIGEVNVSHTYYFEGDEEYVPIQGVGYLGVDFELDQGFYRFSRIYEGGIWDTDARSVFHYLDQEERRQCNYLFKVNGMPVDTSKAPWAAFQGLGGQTVTLTVSATANPQEAIDVVVKLLDSEYDVRYRHWVGHNRSYVSEKSEGKIGYIYVPNTSDFGQDELFRQFYGQMNKKALIIDDRWNAGGNFPDRFIELLNRPVYLYIFERYENDWRIPMLSHQGPKCMLINGESGSSGEILPYMFRKAGLGPLIGMRTWGGALGIMKNPELIDGAIIIVPFLGFYETDGTLAIEGHGVDPDIEVIDNPALMVDGSDPQLDAAIRTMLDQINKNPYVPAKRPPYPDRRGMGILEKDK